MLTSAIKIASVAFIAVLIVVACHVCLFLDTLTQTTAQMPVTIDGAIAREGILTRAAASKQITAIRTDLLARVDTIEADSFRQIDQIRIDANQQIAETRTAAVNEIAKVSTPAGATIADIQGMLPPAQHILVNASETSDLLLDCAHNPDCLWPTA